MYQFPVDDTSNCVKTVRVLSVVSIAGCLKKKNQIRHLLIPIMPHVSDMIHNRRTFFKESWLLNEMELKDA